MTESQGLRRVLETIAPALRAQNASGAFSPSTYATPLSVASYALDTQFLLCVCATSTESEQLRDALAALLPGDEVALWPAWDTHPLERVSPDSAVMATRVLLRSRLQQGDTPRVLVASVRALCQILSPETMAPPLEVLRGGELDRDRLLVDLVRFGYRRENLVEHRAEFAVRGGIVDVWPAQGDEPIRLDFFGDELERLTTFDIANQRSLRDLDEAVVAPAREWLLSAESRRAAERMIGPSSLRLANGCRAKSRVDEVRLWSSRGRGDEKSLIESRPVNCSMGWKGGCRSSSSNLERSSTNSTT